MARVIVLGSGTSSGVPIAGFDYPDAFLAQPRNWRTRPSLLIEGPEGNLLVDCGPDLRTQLLREKVKRIDAALITHTHADHIMGMDDLRPFCLLRGSAMPIYTSPEYQADIRRIFPYAFADFPPGIEVPRFELRDVPVDLEVCGLSLKTFWVLHGMMPVLGFRLGGFAYVTDVSEIPESVWPELLGLEILILDAVRRKPHPNHFHFDRAIEVAHQLGARQTYFTHLSHDFDHDETNASLPPEIQLSYDGQVIDLG